MIALNDQLILFAGLLFTISILASMISRRLGAPLLLVFLILGMFIGPEGLGISYTNLEHAHLVGSLALALILFDGGLSTQKQNFRVGLKPAVSLATVGVLLTAMIIGLLASWIFKLPLAYGLLFGAIVGSTDAAAVFSLLHTANLELKQRVGATLEIESGSNDPMAIFLTVLMIEWILMANSGFNMVLLLKFVQQMGLGALLGLAGGWLAMRVINRSQLSPGLYPLLAMSLALLIFGASATLGGSGFLSVYLAGIYLGNQKLQSASYIKRFHDGLAWLAQIVMFLMLGIMVIPSQVMALALPALLLALALIFIARPLAVVISLLPFRFAWREQAFISWVGLRGAVPIILAIFPALAGVNNSELFFNLAFFVVMVSLVLQGWTIPWAARLTKVEIPPRNQALQRMELDLPNQPDLELSGYRLTTDSPVVGKTWPELRLPKGAKLLFCLRGNGLMNVHEFTDLQCDDQLYFVCASNRLGELERKLFQQQLPSRLSERSFFGEFTINGNARLGELAMLYGFELADELQDCCLHDYLQQRFGQPVVGDSIKLGEIELVVRDMRMGQCTKVGLKLPH